MSDRLSPPTQAVVILEIPQANPVVAPHRSRFDTAAALGVPAHVTIIHPFATPGDLSTDEYARLTSTIRSVPRFECTFREIGWFGDDCAWLRPDDDQPFRALTHSVWEASPDYPPYEGGFDDVIPHLTIGERRLGTLEDLQHATSEVTRHLPIRASLSEAALVAGTAPGSWSVVHRFPLGQPASSGAERGCPELC